MDLLVCRIVKSVQRSCTVCTLTHRSAASNLLSLSRSTVSMDAMRLLFASAKCSLVLYCVLSIWWSESQIQMRRPTRSHTIFCQKKNRMAVARIPSHTWFQSVTTSPTDRCAGCRRCSVCESHTHAQIRITGPIRKLNVYTQSAHWAITIMRAHMQRGHHTLNLKLNSNQR